MDLATFLFLALAFGLGYACRAAHTSSPPTSPGSTDSGPRIVVNVPAEFKPLDTLPPTAIEGARASLWWTVFKHTLDEASQAGYSDEIGVATEAAESAVDKVFGPAP